MRKYLKIECGKTRSGKPICEHPISEPFPGLHKAHSDFDSQEHFNAFAVFTFLEDRCGVRLGVKDIWVVHYSHQANTHKEILEKLGKLAQLREENGIKTFFDLRLYARKLVHPAFR